ncbi:hypothetical protein CL653_00650 [bacterium]|nr:hypothetical protein [bacterium]|tara:strand:+ start:872 stop:1129 length:258 start_codon:yes stop_codon:yes gene_type:complete
MTADEVASSVVRNTKLRGGLVFQLRDEIWKWLLLTSWFEARFPEQHDKINFVDEIEESIRKPWIEKAKKTRRRNALAARQLTLKL